MSDDTSQALFHRDADQLREVVDAKLGTVWTAIDGIRSVLERVTTSVEKQAEQNTTVALMANTLSHFQQTFVEHRAETDKRFEGHAADLKAVTKRLDDHDKTLAVRSITRTGLMTAMVAGVTASGVFVTQHFDKLIALVGLG